LHKNNVLRRFDKDRFAVDLNLCTASYLAAQGASLAEIADTLGHQTMSMVKRYLHAAPDRKAHIVARTAKGKGL
jgi:hypothetical protein